MIRVNAGNTMPGFTSTGMYPVPVPVWLRRHRAARWGIIIELRTPGGLPCRY